MRVHLNLTRLTIVEADTLDYYVRNLDGVNDVKIFENTADAVVEYSCERAELIKALARFHFDEVNVPTAVLESSDRMLNAEYKEKLINHVLVHYGKRFLLPTSVRTVITVFKSVKYICAALKSLKSKKLDVSVLDATAITVSILRGTFDTAGSVMFLLGVGEIMEEWTHRKSVSDLAKSMALQVQNVWLVKDGQEILIPSDEIVPGDDVVVRMGTIIPFDGTVINGEGMVNQASLTGESEPIRKALDSYVYAGTVLEEGELTIHVRGSSGATRYEKITAMIEDTEKLKSNIEGKAEHLADKLVPWTLGGTVLTYLLTRNMTKTLSVLMVDFSCALKLAIPITVLTAIKQCGDNGITVKGGKFLEAVSEADTIVFDKTGTLTKATPTVADVIPFCGTDPDALLKIAACLEEHFPHSMAKAVCRAAAEKDINHEEMHTKVEYIVAHGISSHIGESKVIIGSYHFVFDDEKCTILPEYKDRFKDIPNHYSPLYLAIDGILAAVILIEDPLRPEAEGVIKKLHELGISKVVMMTGDNCNTAAEVANKLNLDEYYAEVLPEDKANFVLNEKKLGRKVIMVGDGINDSPALSASDAGIAISDGAELAREIADITVSADSLQSILKLVEISKAMVSRINKNYRNIVVINGTLIGLGVTGIIQPTTSATIHNLSTLGISIKSMNKFQLEDKN
jgi:heavy metal translocating P-type ATPase